MSAKVKCLTVVDEISRQGLAIRVRRNLTATDVTRILEELFRQHSRPICIRSDNGPKLVSRHLQNWLRKKHVDTHYIDDLHGYFRKYGVSEATIYAWRKRYRDLTSSSIAVPTARY
jgi:transposase InsO family protein